jgi:F1F0 ATPase subunit 2
MNDALTWMLAWMAGGLLGATFFGGLWWTVLHAASSRRPALWLVASFVVRMTVALTGFTSIGGGHAPRLLFCLFGFVLARPAVTALTQPSGRSRIGPAREDRHAPQPR